MTGPRFIPNHKIVLLVAALTLAGGESAKAVTPVSVDADSPMTILKYAADKVWQGAVLAWQDGEKLIEGVIQTNTLNTTNNTALTGTAVLASGQAQSALLAKTTDASRQTAYDLTSGLATAQLQMQNKSQDAVAAACVNATLTANLGNATTQVAAILKQSAPTGTSINSVADAISQKKLLTSPDYEFDPKMSKSQRDANTKKDVDTYFCNPNSDGVSGGNCVPNADTDLELTTGGATRTQTTAVQMALLAQSKYACGEPPENTTINAGYRARPEGVNDVDTQRAVVASYNRCMKVFNEVLANRAPVVTGTPQAAVTAILSQIPGQTPSFPNGVSREEILHALYQTPLEVTDGTNNPITAMYQLDPAMAIRTIAVELLMTNYMLYDLHEQAIQTRILLSPATNGLVHVSGH